VRDRDASWRAPEAPGIAHGIIATCAPSSSATLSRSGAAQKEVEPRVIGAADGQEYFPLTHGYRSWFRYDVAQVRVRIKSRPDLIRERLQSGQAIAEFVQAAARYTELMTYSPPRRMSSRCVRRLGIICIPSDVRPRIRSLATSAQKHSAGDDRVRQFYGRPAAANVDAGHPGLAQLWQEQPAGAARRHGSIKTAKS